MSITEQRQSIWEQLVAQKDEWIGGTLEDISDSEKLHSTIIEDLKCVPGDIHPYFRVCGKKFNCGFNTGYGGIIGGSEPWITFATTFGLSFRIKKVKE